MLKMMECVDSKLSAFGAYPQRALCANVLCLQFAYCVHTRCDSLQVYNTDRTIRFCVDEVKI